MRRLWPSSLFGRLLLVLAGGLLVAQLLSAAINAAERGRLVSGNFGMQPAQRIADVVQLLDGLGAPERQRVRALFQTPPLVLSLHAAPTLPDTAASGWHAQMFAQRLQGAVGETRQVRLQAREGFAAAASGVARPGMHEGRARGGMGTGDGGGGGGGMMGRSAGGGGMAGAGAYMMQIEVQLKDGSWAAFDTALPEAPQALPLRVALSLAVLLAAVLGLSFIAVRWVVRPLQDLTAAAQALGQDLNRAPLPEDGPREVRQAAQAFNTMQQRLLAFINDRTRVLTALSHDLKTPLTRMRLRADLMDDEEQRLRFESDLKEMETMVTHTLDFMRGLGGNEARTPVDMAALLAALQADNQAMGRTVDVQGRPGHPVMGVAHLLKRALGNLVDNAVLYGGQATVLAEEGPGLLTLRIQDQGPGIPAAELERVFDPFYRLEASRSRATGGTGLGLGIARNILRTHGGDVVLHNRPEGGLQAVVTLPTSSR
ncbi:MAG: HAMP domain-containing protein [Rubrivivax sp.]|nr:HAMP domain-containing protein [Rubrivivax sp.]